MPSLKVEKQVILESIATVFGDVGVLGAPIPISFPPLEHEIAPYLSIVESVELHLGIPCDRTNLKKIKPMAIDMYLPGRDLYVELDREGHDFTEARGITFHYFPAGIPRGFSVANHQRLIATFADGRAEPPGMGKMNAGRALNDFVKDLYIEGILGKPLVRLPKDDLVWLLGRAPREEKLARLADYLTAKSDELGLSALKP